MLNQCLEGDVTLEVQVVSELQCWDYCIRQKDCTAYNYYHAIGQSLKTCQLLSKYVGLPISQKGCTHHIVHKKKKNIKVRSDFNVSTFKGAFHRGAKVDYLPPQLLRDLGSGVGVGFGRLC